MADAPQLAPDYQGVPTPKPDPRPGATEAKAGYATLAKPEWHDPVSIAEDVIGRFSPSKAADNALRDAVRGKAQQDINNFNQSQDQ